MRSLGINSDRRLGLVVERNFQVSRNQMNRLFGCTDITIRAEMSQAFRLLRRSGRRFQSSSGLAGTLRNDLKTRRADASGQQDGTW